MRLAALRRNARTLMVALALALGTASAPRGALGQDDGETLPLDPMQRLVALDERIAEARAEVERAGAERARVEAEIAGLAEGRASANRRVRERTRALYRLTRAGALPLAGGIDAMLGHVSRVERLERMVRHDVDALRDLRARANALRDQAGRLATTIDAANARVARLEAQKTAAQDDARRVSMFSATLAGSAPAYDVAPGYGMRVLDAAPAGPAFEAQRGQLGLPLSAPRAIRESAREDGSGVELDGARGAPVRAVSPGRVAFADRHPSYGRLVIVDHGGGYFSIYGGLSRSTVEVGASVSRGTEIGAVDGEPLFFQIRRGTRALDARAWLGI